jgi:hypothetical protein
VIPDARRVSADAPGGLGFSVDIVGKGGEPVKAPRLQVKVIGPAREQYDVALGKEGNKLRGYFQRVTTPGEYKIFASATTESGTETGEAKFLVYAEDVENLRPAADHELLRKIAQAGRGKFYLADEQKFAAFLDDLRRQQTESIKPKVELWPDWRRNPASSATSDQLEILWNSTALGCFLLFSTFLCVEWFLRRRWGMV